MARGHQNLIYDLLFRTSAAATQHLARDPRFVGGQIGLVGVLHTWGRTLVFHPHVHYLAPGGGLAPAALFCAATNSSTLMSWYHTFTNLAQVFGKSAR